MFFVRFSTRDEFIPIGAGIVFPVDSGEIGIEAVH
jgi:hypothetical protein